MIYRKYKQNTTNLKFAFAFNDEQMENIIECSKGNLEKFVLSNFSKETFSIYKLGNSLPKPVTYAILRSKTKLKSAIVEKSIQELVDANFLTYKTTKHGARILQFK